MPERRSRFARATVEFQITGACWQVTVHKTVDDRGANLFKSKPADLYPAIKVLQYGDVAINRTRCILLGMQSIQTGLHEAAQ